MIIDILRMLFLGLSLSAIIYNLYAIYGAIDFFREEFKQEQEYSPPLTIIKPLCGLDWQIYENLASFCEQDYTQYQIVFALRSLDDPCFKIAQKIQQDFPDLDISLIVNKRTIGNNLKVSNLANALTIAKYPILVIADSDIKVGSDYLKEIVKPLKDPQTAVVTCPYNSLVKGKVAIFEALGIATVFNPKIMVARKLEGVSFGFGSTIAIKRAVLEEIGGFEAIADYLSDDFQLANQPYRRGYRVHLSRYIVEHVSADVKLADLFARQLRWAKGVKSERFWGYVGLIFTQLTTNSLFFLLLSQFSLFSYLVFSISWLIRLLMAYIVGAVLFKDSLAKKYLYLVPLRDMFDFFIWVLGFFGDTISWRDNKFKLVDKGKLLLIEEL